MGEKPRAIIVQAQEIPAGADELVNSAPIAIAVSADDFSKSLSDICDLEKLKADLSRNYLLTEQAVDVGKILGSSFEKILVQSIVVASDTVARTSLYAVWIGIEGLGTSKVNYILVREGSETIINFGADASKARSELMRLRSNSSSGLDAHAAAEGSSKPSSLRSGPRR